MKTKILPLRLNERLFLLPIFTVILVLISLVITYAIAASLGHVEFVFPYISYTGIELPERGVFGQLLNICALALAMNVYVRYYRVRLAITLRKLTSRVRTVNTVSLVLGLLAAFGISMVANFETKAMRPPHYVGAALGFGISTFYCWMHTWISRKRMKEPHMRCMFFFQCVNSSLLTIFNICFGVSKVIYKLYDNHEELKNEEGPVRTAYLISTTTEWLMCISIVTFLLTYIPDYKGIKLKVICEECGPHTDDPATNHVSEQIEMQNGETTALNKEIV